jgi:hypothetical protein
MKQPRAGLVRWLFIVIYLAIYKFLVEPHVTSSMRLAIIAVGVIGFLGWLAYDNQRNKKELAEHMQQLEMRRKASRMQKEARREAAKPFDVVRDDQRRTES